MIFFQVKLVTGHSWNQFEQISICHARLLGGQTVTLTNNQITRTNDSFKFHNNSLEYFFYFFLN